jgi:hypothetical protein
MKCVLICKAEDRAQSNLLAQTFGYGPDNFSVPLSADGSEPITHYGGFAAGGITDAFTILLSDAAESVLPDIEWPDGFTDMDAFSTLSKVTIRIEEQWEFVLSELNLMRVTNVNNNL